MPGQLALARPIVDVSGPVAGLAFACFVKVIKLEGLVSTNFEGFALGTGQAGDTIASVCTIGSWGTSSVS